MSYKGKLNFVGHSDKGMVRPNNEDSIGTDLETGLVVVADGMGGYKAGEVASGIAVQTLNEFITAGIKDAHKHQGGADNYSAESMLLQERDPESQRHHPSDGEEPAPVRGHGHHHRRLPVLQQPRLRSPTSAIRGCTASATASSSR